MDTKEQLVVIAEIGRHDLKMLVIRDNLAKLKRDSDTAHKQARELEASIADLEKNKNEAINRRKMLDEKLQQEKSNLRKWEARAEKIKGEREYTALMSEISSQKRTINGVEGEMAELVNEIKANEEKIGKASGAHARNIEQANSAFDEVKELLKEEEERLLGTTKAKEELLVKLPPVIKARYERIYNSRAQQGVAFLKNEVCQACLRKVPPELFMKVLKGEVVEQCPSCLRIMVVEQAQSE